jgi:cytochrome c
MDGRFNTIAGWVLGAGIVLLGAKLVTDEFYKAEHSEQMGYPIAGVVEEGEGGGEAEQPIAHYLQTADAARGEAVFRKCAACHNADQGGANALGPNLFGVMGEPIATGRGGFAFSEALRSHGGNWDWENMSQWLRSPRNFAQGTKMTFAGLGDPQERADVMVFLNSRGGRLTIPPPPADTPAEANGAAPAEANGAAPDIGNAGQPQERGEANTKGPAAPDTSGRAAQETPGH